MSGSSESLRQCTKCRNRNLQGLWWSRAKDKEAKDIGLPEDACEFLFRCKDCSSLSAPITVLADSSRWITHTRSIKGLLNSVAAIRKAGYGSVAVEVWQKGGWWFAEALGFPTLGTRGLTRELVALEVRKRVERRVAALYEKRTGVPWQFTDDDLEEQLRFVQGEDPKPSSSDDTSIFQM
jgi:hypothetical protein